MRLKDAIFRKLDALSDKLLIETDKKKKKELYKEYKNLRKIHYAVLDKDWTELKKNDVSGVYSELKPHSKKIMSDKEYAELMDKWGKIVGEKLLYPEEQEYLDQRQLMIDSMQGIFTPEEQEVELKRFENSWAHRKERAEERKILEQEHKEYVKMINNMTPEELEKFYEPEEDIEREKMYKSVSVVKTNDEE